MNKKGFTLIELLAVIVILAIIALIATPMILGVIENARKGSKESSAYGYLDAIEKYQATAQLEGKSDELVNALSQDNISVTVASINGKITIKGEKPSMGYVTFNNSTIVDYQLQYDDYLVKYNSETKKPEARKGQYEGMGFAVPPVVSIDGISYHVIKTYLSSEDSLVLLRDESLGEMLFDVKDGADFDSSSLKTYLNTTYKETFGEKAKYIKEITLLDFGINPDSFGPVDMSQSFPEGSYLALYKEDPSMFSSRLWTKTKIGNDVIIGSVDNNGTTLFEAIGYSDSSYEISNGMGTLKGVDIDGKASVRPVIIASINILNG